MDGIRIGLIGGSGLGEALLRQTEGTRHEVETPFGRPSDAIIETQWAGTPVFFLSRHGPGHVHSPSQVPYRANILALKQLGCTHVIASGAVGSLRDEFRPRDLVIPDQIIDKTYRRAGTFFERAAVHVEFSEPFCPLLRQILIDAGSEQREGEAPTEPSVQPHKTHTRGCYVCMEGPAFSTRAESLMHRLWGGDLIGMTAMPEAKLAREAEMSYALVALVTDYDCWRRPPHTDVGPGARAPAAGQSGQSSQAGQKPADPPPPDPYVLLQEIIANLRAASDNAVALIRRAVERIARRPELVADAPARNALRLAIWTGKGEIPRDEVERLGTLWMKYFESPPSAAPDGPQP